MPRFWRVFVCWFVTLMLFWLSANLAGTIRPMGLKPFRFTGFPFTIAAWGRGIEEFFDWRALVSNAIIGFGASGLLAWFCAIYRCRIPFTKRVGRTADTA
jgi:hypothetical protein